MDLSQIDMLGKADLGSPGHAMTAMNDDATLAGAGWRKLAALLLAVAAVGLPVNHLGIYVLLLIVAVVVFSGGVTARAKAWLAALAVVAVAVAGQWWLSPPRLDEGHNVFLPDGPNGVLQCALPSDVYQRMASEFDAVYPPAVRCKPGSAGCWQGSHPAHAFAFSADGIFHKSDLSRAAAGLDFSDPVWLRLGFANELRYNWSTAAPDVRRVDRDRRFWMGLHRWHFAMPWFELIRLPAAFVGGELCWRGEIMWEGDGGRFTALSGDNCRAIASADAGRRVFGIAIKPDTLAMHLTPPWRVRLLQLANSALVLAAVVGLVVLLVRLDLRRTIFPFTLLGLATLVLAVDDASFLGGVRPFDGGDDGLFYDGVGRIILQRLLSGDIAGFLQGGENVFYYGGPGLRYFRAIEHIVFGESYLGYLSLVLLLPFLAYWLFNRFLPRRWAIAVAIIFTAVPVGALFGTTFFQYGQWASRGFADPAAYILFIAGILPIVGAGSAGPGPRSAPALFGALLLALGICMKPIVAPAAAVLLGGAGLAALYRREWPRLAGLCIGFLPVFSMALHNWIYGHVFVLFSANAHDADLLVMPPSAWVAAARELAGLHFTGAHVARALQQFAHWLSGPAESYATVPLNAAGIAILVWVVLRGSRFDPWLRLIGAAALGQHVVAFFYNAAIARYHFLSWFLTAVVAVVWFHDVGIGWLRQHYPALSERFASHPISLRLASGLARLQKVSS
jgi:hypothetical protein